MALDRQTHSDPVLPPEYIDPTDRLGSILDVIKSTGPGGIFRGNLGPAEPAIYSSREFIHTVLSSSLGKRGTEFRFMTGPIVLTDLLGQSGLLDELMDQPGIQFKFRPAFFKSPGHCAIGQNSEGQYTLYLEDRNGTHFDTRPAIANQERYTPYMWQAYAQQTSGHFDTHWRLGAIDTPYLASSELFRQLQKEGNAGASVFDYLGPEDLKALPSGKNLKPFART